MENPIKTTPLNQWHHDQHANMADFGGYDMPLWYPSGVKNEHRAVLESAGLFDTSHMACLLVDGQDAFNLLQRCHTRDLRGLMDNRCTYGAILNTKGHVIDDAIIYRFSSTHYMVCVNAGMGSTIFKHLCSNQGKMSVEVKDLSDRLGKIDLQGKSSAKVLRSLIQDADQIFDCLPYFAFKGHFDLNLPLGGSVRLTDGTPILLSRSGYTGEFGFEIFIDPNALNELWAKILETGETSGVIPCGLGARDSLRTGALLPLSHQDIGAWKFMGHPWMFALPLDPDGNGFTKEFIGKEALLDPKDVFYTYPFVGENLRKIGTGKDTSVIDPQDRRIGHVLSCATDMGIGWHHGRILSIASENLPSDFNAKGISCGFVLVDRQLQAGDRLLLQEKKRMIPVMVVEDIRPDRTARKKLETFL